MSAPVQPAAEIQVGPTAIFTGQENDDPVSTRIIRSFEAAIKKSMSTYLGTEGYRLLDTTFEGLSATIENLTYTGQPTDDTAVSLAQVEYSNNTDLPQTMTWQETRTTTVTGTVSVTEALEAGADVNFGIPDIGLGVGVEFTASVSTTRTQAVTATQTWTWSLPIDVPPHTKVTAKMELSRSKYDLAFTATARVDGGAESCVAVGTKGIEKYRVIEKSPGDWFSMVSQEGFSPDGTSVKYVVKGTINDVQGMHLRLSLEDTPIQAGVAGDAATHRTYVIENGRAVPLMSAVQAV